jgi:ATP-binding cassette subfamily C protein LapB
MDARSEQLFVSRFKSSGLQSTLLVITHRTSLLTVVDRVVILENGKVAGMGTTDQFMRAQSDRNVAAEIVRSAATANAGREPPTNNAPAQSTQTSPGIVSASSPAVNQSPAESIPGPNNG